MSMSGATLRKLIPFPKPTDSLSLCADWEATAKAVDNVDEGQQDYLQAGVVEAEDWSFTATINTSTGAIGSSAATGGIAWLPDPVISGALMRSVTADAVLAGLAPSALPISGKYMVVGVELAASTWGEGAATSLKSGGEYGTQAEAEAHSPATSEGKLRVRDLVVHNASGVYSIAAQIDRRPYVAALKGEPTIQTEPAEGDESLKIAPTSFVARAVKALIVGTSQLAEKAVTGEKLGGGTSRQEPGTPQTVRSWGMINGATIEAGTYDFLVHQEVVGLNNWKWTITFGKARKAPYLLLVEGQPESATIFKGESSFTLESKDDVIWGFEVVAEA